MVTTRNKIITYLENRGPATAIELSHALKLTPANIRHHLRVLEKEGVIVSIQRGKSTVRGRPAQLYTLTEQQKAHNFDRLCAAFLQKVRSLRQEEIDALLRAIAEGLIAKRDTHLPKNLTQRLISAAKTLNEMSYKVSWEAHREAPTLKFSHCPYASLVDSFPELCKIDLFLLETLMQCPVEVLAIRQPSPTGEATCRFRLRQPNR